MILCVHCVKSGYCQDHEETTFRLHNRLVKGQAVGCEYGQPSSETLTDLQKVKQIIGRNGFMCIDETESIEIWKDDAGGFIEEIEIDKVFEKVYSNIRGYFSKGDIGYTYKSFLSQFGKE